MHVCCPCCGTEFPIEAGFAEGDGKRLAAVFAELDPAIGRAALPYLRLFKPPKTALRMSRAAAIARELADLVATGSVCRDERGGVRRPATATHWVAGIEQMLAQRDRLELPLGNHNYLRTVVFGLADKADADAERSREKAAQQGRGTGRAVAPPPKEASRLDEAIAYIRQMVHLGKLDQDKADRQIAELRAKEANDGHA